MEVDGSRWKSVGVIGSQQQRVFVVVGSCRESLGAIGSHREPLGAVGVNYVSLPNQSPRATLQGAIRFRGVPITDLQNFRN